MTKIEYNGSIVATVESGNTATLPIKDKKMKSDIVITVPEAEVATDSPLPTEVSTEAEMTALLESGEVGGVYKYTGTTGTYENGALYVLEEENSFMFELTGIVEYSHKYNFDNGMTWQDFVASDYNTTGHYDTAPASAQGKSFYGDSNSEYNTPIYFAGPSGGISVYLNGVAVMEFDLVQSGVTYTATASAAGGGN
jgi:hypothetical protein